MREDKVFKVICFKSPRGGEGCQETARTIFFVDGGEYRRD